MSQKGAPVTNSTFRRALACHSLNATLDRRRGRRHKGRSLEEKVGSHMAGTLIYYASRPDQPAPHFFATNNDALADLRKCAAEQTA